MFQRSHFNDSCTEINLVNKFSNIQFYPNWVKELWSEFQSDSNHCPVWDVSVLVLSVCVCVCLVVGVLVPPGRQVINHGQEQAGPALTQSTSRTNTETTPQSPHWCSGSWWWCWWFCWLYSICVWKVSFVSVSFMPGPGPGQTSPDHKSNVRQRHSRYQLELFFLEGNGDITTLHCIIIKSERR